MIDRLPALSLDECELKNGVTGYVVKIQTESAELNVWLSPDELSKLRAIATADWDSRRSLKAGRSGDAPVFWCSNESGISALIGDDDETWDFGLFLPAEFSKEIARLASDI